MVRHHQRGAVWLVDSDVKNGVDGKASFDTSFGLGGGVGYDFGLARVEGEIEYRDSSYDKVGVDTADKENAGGSIKSLALMLNGYYDFHNPSLFTPFIMAGIGGARIDTDDTAAGGVTIPDDDSWQFAFQVGAGVGWEFSPPWVLDISYRFFATTDPEFDSTQLQYRSHNVLVGLRYQF